MTTATTVRQLDSENPWPGLESFQENAHDFFFGRDREAESLLNHVRDASVTVLYGRSGLGKTSLLRAGLFPALREENFLPIYVRLELQKGSAPLSSQLHQSVRDSIEANVPDAPLPNDDESLWEYLHRRGFELWSAQNYPLTPVFVLDQFEELFTLGERVPDLVRDFMNDLGDLAENRIPVTVAARIDNDEAEAARFQLRSHNYKLLITLREDFLPHLEEWCRLIPALGRSRVRLLPLRADKAFDAVHKPAAQLMSAGLAERVVRIVAGEDLNRGRDGLGVNGDRSHDDLRTSGVEPALLSLFCRELNEERKRRGQPEFDEHLVEDAKRDILSNYYSSCVRDLPPRVAEFIESELITEKGFRDSYAREDAVPSRLTDDELSRLISSRLLRLEEYHGAQRIELTHDVLTGVVREHRDRRRAEEETAAVAARAEQEKQAFAEAAERHAVELERERRASRRFRKLSAALAIVCVAAIVLAVVAYINVRKAADARNDANAAFLDATAQKLFGESQLMLAGLQAGGSDDVLGVQELLAALAIPSKYRGQTYPLLGALNQERDLLKVIDVPETVTSAAFSPDGTRIVSGSTDKTVRLWDAATGQPIGQPLRGHDNWVTTVAFSPDGGRIASAGMDGTIRMWDAATGKPVGQPMHGNGPVVAGLAFSPDGTRIASTGGGGIQLWDAATRSSIGEPLTGHDPSSIVWDVAFSPDSARIVSASTDKTIRLWDAVTGSPIGQLLRGHDETVTSVAFSPDGTRIASGSDDKTVRLWDASSGRPVGEPLRTNAGVISVAFSPDGSRVASAGGDKTIRLWDVATGRETGILNGHDSAVESVAFSRDGRRLVSGGDDTTIRVWDPTSWQPMVGHDDSVSNAEFTDDGRRIASGSKDKTVRWWDTVTGRPIGQPLRVDDTDVDNLFPFGKDRLLSVGSDKTVIRLWDAHTLKPIGEPLRLPPDILNLRSISWQDKTDRIAATADLGIVQVWNATTMRPIGEPIMPGQLVTGVNLSEDGRMLATGESGGTDGTIRLWDAGTGKPIGEPMRADGIVSTVGFSRDGKLVAVESLSGPVASLRLWDTGTSQPVGNPMKLDSVGASEFSPDGRILATGSLDGTIRLWNVADQTQLGAPLTGHTGAVTDLDFSPDGTKLTSTSDDHTLRLWPMPTASPEALCAKLTHNMSREQWDQVVGPEIGYITACPGLPEANDAG